VVATNWHYFVMPESSRKRFAQTHGFRVVGDQRCEAGKLVDTNGLPRYPILISLAAEAVADDENRAADKLCGQWRDTVGRLFGVPRLTMARRGGTSAGKPDGGPSSNVTAAKLGGDQTFTKVVDHALVSHIPAARCLWHIADGGGRDSLGHSHPTFLPTTTSYLASPADGCTVIGKAILMHSPVPGVICAPCEPLMRA